MIDNPIDFLRDVVTMLEDSQTHPYGPEADASTRPVAGQACVDLCNGNQDQARTLWKLLVDDANGYMPAIVARALIRATRTNNLVPDVEPPPVT